MFSSQVGLKISQKKLEVLIMNKLALASIKVNNNDLPNTDSLVYLGSIITPDSDGRMKDIQNRLNKARGAFIDMNNIWKSSQYSDQNQAEIIESAPVCG